MSLGDLNYTLSNEKSVYGPVNSWRLGISLGIDPIFVESTCSFNCTYCQLGNIQNITNSYQEYLPTEKVIGDYQEFLDQQVPFDVITYSGSGEPTLAANLGEIISSINSISPDIHQCILTNATMLHHPQVVRDLKTLSRVVVKLDACNEAMFQRVNRPAPGVTLEKVIEGICQFREQYDGALEVQTMFFPINLKQDIEELAKILSRISPNSVQLNTPKRPYPLSWHRENRGNHLGIFDYEVQQLKTITREQSHQIAQRLRELTSLEIIAIR